MEFVIAAITVFINDMLITILATLFFKEEEI